VTGHSSLSNAEVKNGWRYTSVSSYAFYGVRGDSTVRDLGFLGYGSVSLVF
jgi:hypothetical protein